MSHNADGPGGWEAFDVGTAKTEYWESVPIVTNMPDRKEDLKELTVRILSGYARQNHNLRILRIHISSEDDLVFLHSLEVSEDEFQALKAEQGILVDFSNFPGKVVGLLGKCVESRNQEIPRYQAVLTVAGGESKFQIVETNDFNKLPHITLKFRPGTDPSVKQFLAFRLSEVKSECHNLEDYLRNSKQDNESLRSELAQTRARLEQLELRRKQELLEVAANEKSMRVTLQEQSTRDKSMLREQLDRERTEIETRLREELQAVKARNEALDSENRELNLNKHELDAKVADLERRLTATEGQRTALQEECEKLREQVQELHTQKHEVELCVNESRVSCRGLEEQVERYKDTVKQRQEQIESLECIKLNLESRCEELRQTVMKTEEKVQEIQSEKKKADQIIAKFASDLQISRDKTRRNVALLARTGEQVDQLKRLLQDAEHEKRQLLEENSNLQRQKMQKESENSDLRQRCVDYQGKLEESSRMTRWLNEQMNDRQLLGHGSRHQFFQPTSQLPTSNTYNALQHSQGLRRT